MHGFRSSRPVTMVKMIGVDDVIEGCPECDFCLHRCSLPPGGTGRCGVRRNEAGRLCTTVYGEIQAWAVDPIEKKPLFHFLPGSRTFSLALGGCNFVCPFCQNGRIAFSSRLGPPRVRWSPRETVEAWQRSQTPTLSFTYTEPGVWQDYLRDVAALARKEGARIVMVTNGYLTSEALDRLIPLVDAFNVDLKGGPGFYGKYCGAEDGFEGVVGALERIAPVRHLEVTSLVIEGIHTGAELEGMFSRLVSAGVSVWHLSRFFPAGSMSHRAPTGEAFLEELLERFSRKGGDGGRIPFIYGGNCRHMRYQRTLCPRCGSLCISRGRSAGDYTRLGRCPSCGAKIYGVFSGSSGGNNIEASVE
ncbi:pyruvate formate lyase activating enzyme [Alkalispirochaeta americana]|uniref:Pyruvate formate lyase activating enzyme n=1 Tax=Alkalispirochaeta americana TaxID=159291 RepID=A0A1N6TW81_9SPIO|nr:radical SAM protein [Alkalispirochaeta americana]SIQ57537.1 pyruvate formate lyase activating enzyme [Alkalispirochaeta americana]